MDCRIKKAWIEIEKEHTKNISKVRKIVKDHLKEHGCRYYPELIKMEKRLNQK